jgi:hypothetical protein
MLLRYGLTCWWWPSVIVLAAYRVRSVPMRHCVSLCYGGIAAAGCRCARWASLASKWSAIVSLLIASCLVMSRMSCGGEAHGVCPPGVWLLYNSDLYGSHRRVVGRWWASSVSIGGGTPQVSYLVSE